MRVLITGGAGFVGSALARLFRRDHPTAEIVAFDNLKRRGSEINVALHRKHNITFVHGDIRVASDLSDLPGGSFDVFIEASAEPSVHAGLTGSPAYLIDTNLVGTLNCLEFARQRAKRLIFLSTSRVYSIAPLREIPLVESESRFEIGDTPQTALPGLSAAGIAENFPTHLPRSLYGATKLASEMIIQEYCETYGLKAVINRCGVICGPGQFGKVDQGVFTMWVASHHFGKPLRYTGFGGTGKQVRDLLHPEDLYKLAVRQIDSLERFSGQVFNVGGGRPISVSMRELTEICRQVTGRTIDMKSDPTTASVDIPLYLTDARRAKDAFDWTPSLGVEAIVRDIHKWIAANEAELRPIFA